MKLDAKFISRFDDIDAFGQIVVYFNCGKSVFSAPTLELLWNWVYWIIKIVGLWRFIADWHFFLFSLEFADGTMMGEARKKKKKKFHIKKKFKKFIIPLLIAYKLKFFAMIPLLIGGLVLLVGSTGMAGFFFALFAAVISLKKNHS